jgi:hypothetical protein
MNPKDKILTAALKLLAKTREVLREEEILPESCEEIDRFFQNAVAELL